MNREDIIRMAQEAGFYTEEWGDGLHHICVFNFQSSETEITKELELFAEIVRKDYSTTHANIWLDRIHKFMLEEREACAKIAHQWSKRQDDVGGYIEAAIRSRGQA